MKIKATLFYYTDWLRRVGLSLVSRPNPRPVIILGNQKAGTTIVSWLLSELCEEELSPELRTLNQKITDRIAEGRYAMQRLIRQNSFDLSKPIIKDNNLTFLYHQLKEVLPEAQYVMIIRDPRDNIRSILNRLKIPGTVKGMDQDQLKSLPSNWREMFAGRGLAGDHRDIISLLAERWNYCAEIYLEDSPNFKLVIYEEFLSDKALAIYDLANDLGLKTTGKIEEKVDRQLQVKGNRKVDWIEFFGEENYQKINTVCSEYMKPLGFKLEATQPYTL